MTNKAPFKTDITLKSDHRLYLYGDSFRIIMRVLSIISAIFVFAVLFLTLNAESEECQYENMTVSSDQNIVLDGEHIWLCGDILIDGHLVIKDSY